MVWGLYHYCSHLLVRKLRPREVQPRAVVALLVSHCQPACLAQSILSPMLFCLFLYPTSFSLMVAHCPLNVHSQCILLAASTDTEICSHLTLWPKRLQPILRVQNLCVMSLHTTGWISRRWIVGPKWNTFKVWIDTTKLPFKEWFFICSLYSFLLPYLFFHPLAQQGLILFTTRNF